MLVGWAILFPLIFWCARRDPAVAATTHRSGARLGQWAALRDAHFWSVALPFALAIAAQVGFIVHMVAFLLPLLGRDGTSLAVTCSSVSAMIGRLTLGGAIDRLPRRATSAVCFLSQALGLGLLLTWPGSEAAVYTGIVLFGLSVGNVITLPTVIVQVTAFPGGIFGTIIGLSGAVGQLRAGFRAGPVRNPARRDRRLRHGAGDLHGATDERRDHSAVAAILTYKRSSGTSIHRASATLR